MDCRTARELVPQTMHVPTSCSVRAAQAARLSATLSREDHLKPLFPEGLWVRAWSFAASILRPLLANSAQPGEHDHGSRDGRAEYCHQEKADLDCLARSAATTVLITARARYAASVVVGRGGHART